MAPWASLPRDILSRVLRQTGRHPAAYAGVCRGWAACALDDADHRRELALVVPWSHALHGALHAFAAFVCTRPPVTRRLDVRLCVCYTQDAVIAAAALGAVLVHLAPSLEALTLEPGDAAWPVTCTPFLDVCTRLASLRCAIRQPVDLRRVGGLRAVDLRLTDPACAAIELPPTLTSCRLGVGATAPSAVLDAAIERLPTLTRLRDLALCGDHAFVLRVGGLAPSLRTLLVHAGKSAAVLFDADLPELRVLGLARCSVGTAPLSRFLLAARRLRALQLNYMVMDPAPRLDLRALPLEVVHLVSSVLTVPLRCTLPRGVRVLAMGLSDLGGVLRQADVRATVRHLKLDVEHGPAAVLASAWPADRPLPALERVDVAACGDTALAATLGQRCGPRVEMRFLPLLDADVEADLWARA